MADEPLIYTSKGNLPISSLTYETQWILDPGYIQFVERHRDSTGEVVRESAHVYDLSGVAAAALAAQF
jgi:hypothetical protein